MTYKEHRGLSPSSLALFTGCQRKYYYKKVAKIPIDSDVSEEQENFDIGKTFHKVLEDRMHVLSGLTLSEVIKTAATFNLGEEKAPLIFAMLGKYKIMHEKAGLEATSCEVIIDTPTFYGIADVILTDSKKNWWVGDMKTSASYSPLLVPTLAKHPQLNLYGYHHKEIAEVVGLDPEKYMGCRYRLTTKSKASKKVKEETVDFINRISDTIRSIDYILPKDKMAGEEMYEMHSHAVKYMATCAEVAPGEKSLFKPNYGNCLSYFRPCEYFSNCHGSLFTESKVESVE